MVRAGHPTWEALRSAGAAPVCFVPASDKDPHLPYELQIQRTGRCPTRDDWHDFFNGLAWLRFPHTKARLNHLHAAALTAARPGSPRGRLRDAMTVFDENAALLWAPDPVWKALVAKDWSALFGPMRPLWEQCRIEVFGHALLDKLRTPRKALTAHVLRVPATVRADPDIDTWMARLWTDSPPSTRDFAHLPLLGVPGWWAENEDPAFHVDNAVFRKPIKAAARH